MSREQIHPYVDREVRRRLRAYCAAKDVTETAVVEAAVRDYLDDSRDSVQIMRRLDRLTRADQRLQRDLDVLSEAFGVFVRLWCSYVPEIGAAEKEAANRLAASRYQSFLDLVAQQFGGGHRLVDLVVRESVADSSELAAAVDEDRG